MTSHLLLKIFLPAAILLVLAFVAPPTLAVIKSVPDVLNPAGDPCGFAGGPSCAGATTNTIITFLDPFISAALFLIGTLALIFLVYAGVKYIMSRGDEQEASRAKMQIAYAVIGIVVALGARTIYSALETTGTGDGQAGAGKITGLATPFISMALTLVGITAAIFLVYAGFKYISSRGEEEEAKQAKMQIAYAIIGITVAILAVAITKAVIVPLGGVPAPDVFGAYPLDLFPGIVAVVNSLISLVGIAAVIFLVYAGVKYISSTGDEEEAGQAKRQIVYAIIGLTVVLLSGAIADLVVFPLVGQYAPRFYGTYVDGTAEEGIRAVVNALLSLVGIAAAIFLVYAGVKYIMSEGDEEEANQAKRQIVYAIIGLVVVILSAVIVNIILGTI